MSDDTITLTLSPDDPDYDGWVDRIKLEMGPYGHIVFGLEYGRSGKDSWKNRSIGQTLFLANDKIDELIEALIRLKKLQSIR